MSAVRVHAILLGVLVAGCAAPQATPSASPPAASPVVTATTPSPLPSLGVLELPSGSGALPAGTYTRSGFRPSVTFTVGEGWVVGTATDGFFDVQQDQGTPDVVAVQFARVDGVIGAGGASAPVETSEAAAAAMRENPSLVVLEESESRLGGLVGRNVVVENRGASTAPVMDTQPGQLGFDPGRKLWIALFDTADGVIAVMVGGSVAEWDRALTLAEPVLESVVIAG